MINDDFQDGYCTTNQSFIDDVSNKTSMFLWGISHCQVTEKMP